MDQGNDEGAGIFNLDIGIDLGDQLPPNANRDDFTSARVTHGLFSPFEPYINDLPLGHLLSWVRGIVPPGQIYALTEPQYLGEFTQRRDLVSERNITEQFNPYERPPSTMQDIQFKTNLIAVIASSLFSEGKEAVVSIYSYRPLQGHPHLLLGNLELVRSMRETTPAALNRHSGNWVEKLNREFTSAGDSIYWAECRAEYEPPRGPAFVTPRLFLQDLSVAAAATMVDRLEAGPPSPHLQPRSVLTVNSPRATLNPEFILDAAADAAESAIVGRRMSAPSRIAYKRVLAEKLVQGAS